MLSRFHRRLCRLVVLAMCLQIAVPPGFMPASLEHGWYLKWCPDGMPAAVMSALFGGHHHHHHHAAGAAESYSQCDLAGLSAEPLQHHTVALPWAGGSPAALPQAAPGERLTSAAGPYRSRAPPDLIPT